MNWRRGFIPPIKEMLSHPLYILERARDETYKIAMNDLAYHLQREGKIWTIAIVEQDRGMVLLQPRDHEEKFNGVYYKNLSCGTLTKEARLTATMLHSLGVGASADALFEGFIKVYSRVIITDLKTRRPRAEPL